MSASVQAPARRWPVLRSASAIADDLEAERSATSPDEFVAAWDALTLAERDAALDAEGFLVRSRFPLVGGVRREHEPVAAPRWAMALPGLPEPAAVLLGAMAEVPYARTWSEIAARFGVDAAQADRAREPALHAALDELLRMRIVRRLTDGRLEVVRRG